MERKLQHPASLFALFASFAKRTSRWCALFIVLSSLSTYSFSQNARELEYLIFEPVLISIQEQTLNTQNNSDQESQTELTVSELTTLPTDNPVSLPEYIRSISSNTSVMDTELDPETLITQYEASILELELQGGAYEPALTQDLLSLGDIYLKQGEYEKALETYDRATHINRVNEGLFNLNQSPIIEKVINAHLSQGNLLEADAQQEYLFYLQRKTLGSRSIDLLPAMNRYAEWNVFAFTARLGANPLDGMEAEVDAYTQSAVNNSIGLENFRTRRLVNAQNIYLTMIQIILNNFGVNDPRLLEMEKRLALTNYFFATNYNIGSGDYESKGMSFTTSNNQTTFDGSSITGNSLGYRHGREALERRIDYLLQLENPPIEELTQARIELGDWLLIFKKRMSALEIFDEAYLAMEEAGVPPARIDEIFNPVLPEPVPTFVDYRFSRGSRGIPDEVALEYKGFIDIEYSINRFGLPGSVKILNKSPNTTEPIEDRLFRSIRRTQYRPRYVEGKPLNQDIVTARYYYTF